MTLGTSSPVRQVGKDRREGVLYYYAGWHERVNIPYFAAVLISQTQSSENFINRWKTYESGQ